MNSRPLTDLERTIAMLKRAGARGLSELDTDGSRDDHRAIDGGPPFRRLAARIHEARQLGYAIKTRLDGPGGMARYLLAAPVAGQDELVDLGRVDVDVDLSDFELRTPTSAEPGAGEMCTCARALPAPCPDGELRCARCGCPTNGWQWQW